MAMKLQLQNFIYDKNSIPYFCKKKNLNSTYLLLKLSIFQINY